MPKQSKKYPRPPRALLTFDELADRADALTKTMMRVLLITTLVNWSPEERADLVAQIQELDQ